MLPWDIQYRKKKSDGWLFINSVWAKTATEALDRWREYCWDRVSDDLKTSGIYVRAAYPNCKPSKTVFLKEEE